MNNDIQKLDALRDKPKSNRFHASKAAELNAIWPGCADRIAMAFYVAAGMQDRGKDARSQLKNCDAVSIWGCLLDCASLRLIPSRPLQNAFFVPFKGVCTLMVGYRGQIDLALRSEKVVKIDTFIVREGDDFVVTAGLHQDIRHVMHFKDGAALTHAYAIATYKDGTMQFQVMTKAEIEIVKNCSKTAGSAASPWKTHYNEMCKKTAIHRLCKLLPKPHLDQDSDFVALETAAMVEETDFGTPQAEENRMSSSQKLREIAKANPVPRPLPPKQPDQRVEWSPKEPELVPVPLGVPATPKSSEQVCADWAEKKTNEFGGEGEGK